MFGMEKKNWDVKLKPPADICPQEYCFMWVAPDYAADMSGRVYSSMKESLNNRSAWVTFPSGGCGCSFGICTRMDPINGNRDWYEPCGPALERDGLPWYYFIPSPEGLRPARRAQYLRESLS